MKKLLLTLTVVAATALTMYGQGRVSFNNSVSGNIITITNDPARAAAGQGAPGAVLGSTYSIQLLWAPQGSYATEAAFLAAVLGTGPAVAFLGTTGDAASNAGLFAGGATPNPAGTSMPVASYTMQARAWYNNGQYATYAAALAGGANSTAKLGGARIIRKTPSGLTETPVPMKKLLQAKADDIQMQPDDILFIPTSARKMLEGRTAEAAIQMATSAALITVR